MPRSPLHATHRLQTLTLSCVWLLPIGFAGAAPEGVGQASRGARPAELQWRGSLRGENAKQSIRSEIEEHYNNYGLGTVGFAKGTALADKTAMIPAQAEGAAEGAAPAHAAEPKYRVKIYRTPRGTQLVRAIASSKLAANLMVAESDRGYLTLRLRQFAPTEQGGRSAKPSVENRLVLRASHRGPAKLTTQNERTLRRDGQGNQAVGITETRRYVGLTWPQQPIGFTTQIDPVVTAFKALPYDIKAAIRTTDPLVLRVVRESAVLEGTTLPGTVVTAALSTSPDLQAFDQVGTQDGQNGLKPKGSVYEMNLDPHQLRQVRRLLDLSYRSHGAITD